MHASGQWMAYGTLLGGYTYDLAKPLQPQLDAIKFKIDKFVRLNQKHKIALVFDTAPGPTAAREGMTPMRSTIADRGAGGNHIPGVSAGQPSARSRPAALCSVSSYSRAGSLSATTPPPTGNCAHPRPAVNVRIKMFVSIDPSKPT